MAIPENHVAALTDGIAKRHVKRFGVQRSRELQLRQTVLLGQPLDLVNDGGSHAVSSSVGMDVAGAEFRMFNHERPDANRLPLQLCDEADLLIDVGLEIAQIVVSDWHHPSGDGGRIVM